MHQTLRTPPAVAALALAVFFFSTASGQVTKVGTTAATFLSIPVGARALGMGGAFVGVANDASAMYWNPAGIAPLVKTEALFSHADWIADIGFNYGGIVIPLHEFGTIGLNFTSMSMDDMERTTEDQPEGTGEMFSAGSLAVGVCYARSLTEWFSIGANIKYINEHIWNSTASGFAIDLGTLFQTPFDGLKFGAGISNFGQKLQMSGSDLSVLKDISPNNGNNPNVPAALTTDAFDIPLVLRIGFAYEPIVNEDEHLTLAVDAAHPNDNSESLNLGGEFTVLNELLALRAGYKALGALDSEEKYTLGGGVRYEFTPGMIAHVDYAYEQFGRLQNVHKFAITLQY